MLQHAHTVTAIAEPTRITYCVTCGAPVSYVTRPPKFCASHASNSGGGRYRLAGLTWTEWHARQVARDEPPPVVAAPGFCRVCGCIRLSVVNVSGVCDGCADG